LRHVYINRMRIRNLVKNRNIVVLIVSLLLYNMLTGCNAATNSKNSTMSKEENAINTDTATFGAGCFWCTEAVYTQLRGVISVTSGYSGGEIKNPSYRDVCTGTTGHAEVTQIVYDPSIISFSELLEVFWTMHDPTTLNRQGADIGTQYRSVIFYHSEEQHKIAADYKQRLNREKAFNNPVITEISPAQKFYKAEDYHQDYLENNPNQPYCRLVVLPKVDKIRKIFKEKLKAK
jgi:peptide-methionine (S)-S-oxide reductase